MRRAWLIASESPHLPILLFLAYFGARHILTGGASIPDSMQDAAPEWLIWAWTFSLAVGSVLGVIGLVTEKTRVESVGLVWSMFGIAFYVADIKGGATAATVLLAVMCLIRLNALRRARQRQAHMQRLIAEVRP